LHIIYNGRVYESNLADPGARDLIIMSNFYFLKNLWRPTLS